MGRQAQAQAPPWRDSDDLPLPEGLSSVVTRKEDQPIFVSPSASAARRGAAANGVKLPFYGAKRGGGCAARWLNIGPLAWICQDAVDASQEPALPAGASVFLAPHGLPFRYFFVGAEGSLGYARLEDAEEVAPEQEFQPGFAVAVMESASKGGQPYVRTHHGLWLPERDLLAVSPFEFHGEKVDSATLAVGWIVEPRALSFSAPGKVAHEKLALLQRVSILEEQVRGKETYLRIGEGRWVRQRDVRRPQRSPPPAEIRPGERWIDVELSSQTLVAYEGESPVYATVVSTGKGAAGSELSTPTGTHRIWVKLESTTMDNLEDEEAERYYAIEDVPYVQYFSKGVGLHGAFWHRSFGHVRSHGCVNLAPLDAQWLFGFTSPGLPAGWTATLPTRVSPGTIVRVR